MELININIDEKNIQKLLWLKTFIEVEKLKIIDEISIHILQNLKIEEKQIIIKKSILNKKLFFFLNLLINSMSLTQKNLKLLSKNLEVLIFYIL